MANKSRLTINSNLLHDLSKALQELGGWGSVEIYVQNGKVTQITKRAIKKQITTWNSEKLGLDKLAKII